jgi:hypothetical protein
MVVSCHGIVVMVSLLWSCCCGLVVVAIVIVTIVSIVVSIAFIVAVIIDCCCPCSLHCHPLLSSSWWCSNGGTAMGAAMAEKVVVQQWQWQRSNGDAVQRQLRWRSDGLGSTATA